MSSRTEINSKLLAWFSIASPHRKYSLNELSRELNLHRTVLERFFLELYRGQNAFPPIELVQDVRNRVEAIQIKDKTRFVSEKERSVIVQKMKVLLNEL